mgnify:CR=1 FL=1
MHRIELNDGLSIPQVGLGVWQMSHEDVMGSMKAAWDSGYRHVDTAAIYRNEDSVGAALKTLDRDQMWVTTKVWNEDIRNGTTLDAVKRPRAAALGHRRTQPGFRRFTQG